MADPIYPLFPVCAFLGFLLSLVPLPWHLKAWNSGTCFFMTWASLSCLNQVVNSITWHNNWANHAPAWCEISIRIMMGASVGIPAASLCINRRLYCIITSRTIAITQSDKRRALVIDTLICVIFPALYIALQYVVQGHRFNIFEDIGCFPALYNTALTFVISSMWPLVIGCISAFYCIMTLRAFYRHRIEFTQLLACNSSITLSRYFRLMALAMTELLCTMPLSIFIICLNARAARVEPWISWDDTHFDYSRVDQYPAFLWRKNHLVAVGQDFTRWIGPVSAFIFFAFFGFADEARKNYVSLYYQVASCLRARDTSQSSVGKKSIFSATKIPNFDAVIPEFKAGAHFSVPADGVKPPSPVYTSSCSSKSRVAQFEAYRTPTNENSVHPIPLSLSLVDVEAGVSHDYASAIRTNAGTCP